MFMINNVLLCLVYSIATNNITITSPTSAAAIATDVAAVTVTAAETIPAIEPDSTTVHTPVPTTVNVTTNVIVTATGAATATAAVIDTGIKLYSRGGGEEVAVKRNYTQLILSDSDANGDCKAAISHDTGLCVLPPDGKQG